MAKIHTFKTPVDINNESIANYYANLYKNGIFVEGRHYEMYSGTSMMDEIYYLKRLGYTVEW